MSTDSLFNVEPGWSKKGKDDLVGKLKEALIKDFEDLYQERYTTNWRSERVFRKIEIGIMDLENLVKLIEKYRTGKTDR